MRTARLTLVIDVPIEAEDAKEFVAKVSKLREEMTDHDVLTEFIGTDFSWGIEPNIGENRRPLEPGPQCTGCTHNATWVRRTQFAGDHFFCAEHAALEENFGKDDPSYFIWEAIP
jgi:hypothetical protein